MFAGIRTNSEAMNLLSGKQEVISNNLANVNTVGFRKDSVAVHNFGDVLQATVFSDTAGGVLRQTGNPLDLALEGDGYFSVQTPQGVAYTRNGTFQLSAKGQLVTQDGMPVLSDAGPVTVDPQQGGTLSVGRDGRLHLGAADLGKLSLVRFGSGTNLSKTGHNRVSLLKGSTSPSDAAVVQGAEEESTAQTVPEMVDMMDTQRQFEANQKAIHMQDEVLGQAISSLGGL